MFAKPPAPPKPPAAPKAPGKFNAQEQLAKAHALRTHKPKAVPALKPEAEDGY